MDLRVDRKVAIVTGGSRGIGRAIAAALAGAGAKVMITSRKAEACEATVAELSEETGGDLAYVAGNVGNAEDAERVVEATLSMFGAVDVLVNNAALTYFIPVAEFPVNRWLRSTAVNFHGPFFMSQLCLPDMLSAGRGSIVNISSGAGLGISLTGIQAYAAAKAGQIGLTRQLAHELGPFGITVNNIAPGFVRSNANTEKQWDSYGPEGQEELISRIALRRLGTPADIAHSVMFLASKYAGWITGAVLRVDGGR